MNKKRSKDEHRRLREREGGEDEKEEKEGVSVRHLGATSPQRKAYGQNSQGNGHRVCRIAGRQQERRGEQAQNEEDLLAHGNQANRQIVSADEDEKTCQSAREEDQRNRSLHGTQQGYRDNRR